jgi:toxin ParE1/3/4
VNVVLRPEAVDDLQAALRYYAEIDADLARGFLEEFDLLIERLQMFPRSGRPVEQVSEVRRGRLRRFPYGVFYRLTDDNIRILRVLHSARDQPTLPEADA